MAKLSGYSTHALKFYLRLGLLKEIGRSPSTNFRYFDDSSYERLKIIRGLQKKNYSLKEIQDVLNHKNRSMNTMLKNLILALFAGGLMGFSQLAYAQNAGNFMNQEISDNAAEDSAEFEARRPAFKELVPESGVAQIKEGVTIDELNLEGMNIKDILKLISDKTGFRIIYPESIEGEATLFLRNIDALDALRIILNSINLAYDIQNGAVNVMRADEYERKYSYSFDLVVKSQIVPVSFAKVLNLIDILKPMKSEAGKIIYSGRRIKMIDQSSGKPQEKEVIILIDKPEKVQSMMTLISKIDVPTETKKFSFVNTKADDFAQLIKDMITKNVGQLSVQKESNEITVTDVKENLDKIQKLFLSEENKAKKILIDAKIVQVDLNDEHNDGIDWEAIVSDYQSIKVKGLETVKGTPVQETLNLGVISSEDYTVLIEALDTVGQMEEVAHQNFITLNEKECEVIIPSLDVVTSHETDERKISMSEKKIKLYVLPNRGEKNSFVLRIKPDIVVSNDSKPEESLKISSEKTIVNVSDGSLVVIGGLIKENTITAKKKIPVLGDIPIVGIAFSKEGRRQQKSEVIVFLTPKMVDNADAVQP